MNRTKPRPIRLVPELEDDEESGQYLALEFDDDGLIRPEGIEMDEDHDRVACMAD